MGVPAPPLAWSAVFGWFGTADTEERHEGSEYTEQRLW